MKKKFAVLLASLLLVSPTNISVKAEEGIAPTAAVCMYDQWYTETISDEYYDIQFSHLAKKNSVTTDVTRTVNVTSSLAVTGGYEGEVNFLLANSKAKFELSKTGSKETSVSITWKDIPANETHLLTAGKVYVVVTGTKHTLNKDCSKIDKTTKVQGTLYTFHSSEKQ